MMISCLKKFDQNTLDQFNKDEADRNMRKNIVLFLGSVVFNHYKEVSD